MTERGKGNLWLNEHWRMIIGLWGRYGIIIFGGAKADD
jgi:hypothetical protein